MIVTDGCDTLLGALEGVKPTGDGKWQARCPSHDDSTASLSITSEGERTLVFCHAGCPTADVVKAVGLTMADLGPSTNGSKPHVDKVYDYKNGDGSLEYQVVRMLPKDFRQRRNADNWSVKGCRQIPYRLPELLQVDPAAPVFVVEGEKDCDNLAKLGIVATCNAGGAGKWRAAYAEHLKGRHVVILPDNDEPGRKHAEQVRDSLAGIARSVKVVELSGLLPKGDVSEWIAAGGTAAKLLELATTVDSSAGPAFPKFTLAELTEKFRTLSPPVIHGLIREGETANFIANPKVGKSWAMYNLAINVATGTEWLGLFPVSQGRVLIVDNELHPETLAHRIPVVGDAMSLPFKEYRHCIDTWCLRGNLRSLQELLIEFRKSVAPSQYRLIIFDAKYRFSAAGVSENDNVAETQVYNLLDQIAAETRAALIVVHHASKGGQSDKRVTDVGAGAGAQSRAADCHMVLREHEEEGVAVLDAAVRSFPPVDPVALRWTFPKWRPDEFADASKLKGKLSHQEQKQADRDKEAQDKIIRALMDGPATARQLREKTGLSRERQQRLLDKLVAEDQLQTAETDARGNQTKEYSVVLDVGDD